MRKILHVDMDAFYASIEQRDRPHLRGRPIAVGGDPDSRGVVAAASYEARAFGVRSAMPSRRARRLCPDLVFIPTDFARYRRVSGQLRSILDDYSDLVEPLSLDEAYLDVTDDKAGVGTATRAAAGIRRRVRDELRLTCSVGVAPLKFVAKIASDHRKPDGLTVVQSHEVLDFVHPLPVKVLWGVGPSTLERLEELGVKTVGELARLPEERVRLRLGSRGTMLWRMAHGEDPRTVQTERVRRSRSAERTFEEDVVDVAELLGVLTDQAERIARSLQEANDRGRTVTLKLRYADFTTVTRALTLSEPVDDAESLVDAATQLLARTDAGARPVRLVGLGLSKFESEALATGKQLRLPGFDR